jgi:hypothetical protein
MRTLPCVLFTLLVSVAVAGDDEDPVKARLEKAKEAYKSAREKNKEFLIDHLTKQEESARKAGKVEQVEKTKKALEAYQKGGPLPDGLAANVRQRFTSARVAMDNAFAAAVREYVKAKKDDLAADVQKDWDAFKIDVSDDPTVVRILNKKSEKYATISKGSNEPKVLQYPSATGPTQYFRPVPAQGGWVYLVTLDGKNYLSTDKGGTNNGAAITVAEPRSGAAMATQQWRLVPTSDGWGKLLHRASGKTVGVLDKSTADGGRLVIWSDSKEPHMEWKFE